MKDILFDPFSHLDVFPTNALELGAYFTLSIRLLSSIDVKKVSVILYPATSGTQAEYPMLPGESGGEYTAYACRFCPAETGLYFYRFSVLTDSGKRDIEAEGEPWQLTVYDGGYRAPEWITGGLYYQIFTDRFFRGNADSHTDKAWGETPDYAPSADGVVRRDDHFGGDLEGITEKLPYLAELGVSCIYLCPIFEAESNHKYDTADYMKIDPRYGDEAALRALCSNAEKLGMRVMLDGVFDHTGSNSVYFNKDGRYGGGGAYQSQASPYYNWYQFTQWPEKYACWWGIDTLPQVNETEESYMDFILGGGGVIEKWMDCGVSGWRLDVADELPDAFLSRLRETVKRRSPDGLIIGEVWEDASNKVSYGVRRRYLLGGELDSVTNYPFKNAIIEYAKSGAAEAIAKTVATVCGNYPKPALDCLMNVLGTHDTARIITVLGGVEYADMDEKAEARLTGEDYRRARELLKLCALLQFTLPGVPCIYYGDEAGLQGYDDPFCRRCFPWGQEDTELTEWYCALSRLRREHPCFDGGDYFLCAAQDGVFSFERRRYEDRCTIVCNMGDSDRRAEGRVVFSQNCVQSEGAAFIRRHGFAVLI